MKAEFRVCRKTKKGFEIQTFLTLPEAIKERKKNGGFVDKWDEQLKCWKQLKNNRGK
jgi:hypothetical protein